MPWVAGACYEDAIDDLYILLFFVCARHKGKTHQESVTASKHDVVAQIVVTTGTCCCGSREFDSCENQNLSSLFRNGKCENIST